MCLGFTQSPGILSSPRERISIMAECITKKYEPLIYLGCRAFLGLKDGKWKRDSIVELSDWISLAQQAIELKVKIPPRQDDVSYSQEQQEGKIEDEKSISMIETFSDRLWLYHHLHGKEVMRLRGTSIPFPANYGRKCQDLLENIAYYVEFVHHAKVRDNGPECYGQTEEADLYARYQAVLLERNLVDFEDILRLSYKILSENEQVRKSLSERFQYILVDELQDLNQPQMKILKQLKPDKRRFMAVGDDDQAIYGFRGATSRANFDMIAKDFLGIDLSVSECLSSLEASGLAILRTNYRSTSTILDFSGRLISSSKERISKPFLAPAKTLPGNQSEKITVWEFPNAEKEASYIASCICEQVRGRKKRKYSDFAILFRCMKMGMYRTCRALQRELNELMIPFKVLGDSTISEETYGRVVIDLLKLSSNDFGCEEQAFKNCLAELVPGMGLKTIEQIRANMLASKKDSTEHIVKLYYSKRKGGVRGDKIRSFLRKLQEIRTEVCDMMLIDFIEAMSKKFLETETNGRKSQKKQNEQTDLFKAKEIIMNLAQEFQRGYKLKGKDAIRVFISDLALVEAEQDSFSSGLTNTKADQVVISTIHQAKGLEWPVVFVPHLNQGLLPIEARDHRFPTPLSSQGKIDKKHLEEERRIAYVAFTRAKENLTISFVAEIADMKNPKMQPSQFLDDITKDNQNVVFNSSMHNSTSATANRPVFMKASQLL